MTGRQVHQPAVLQAVEVLGPAAVTGVIGVPRQALVEVPRAQHRSARSERRQPGGGHVAPPGAGLAGAGLRQTVGLQRAVVAGRPGVQRDESERRLRRHRQAQHDHVRPELIQQGPGLGHARLLGQVAPQDDRGPARSPVTRGGRGLGHDHVGSPGRTAPHGASPAGRARPPRPPSTSARAARWGSGPGCASRREGTCEALSRTPPTIRAAPDPEGERIAGRTGLLAATPARRSDRSWR